MPTKDGRRIGMYGETPRVKIGNFSICRQDPDGVDNSVWVEKDGEEGAEFNDDLFSYELEELFYKLF